MTKLIRKYILIDESTDECDFDLYDFGSECDKPGTKALVDTTMPDEDYPEGFHWAHLCDGHAQKVLEVVGQ